MTIIHIKHRMVDNELYESKTSTALASILAVAALVVWGVVLLII